MEGTELSAAEAIEWFGLGAPRVPEASPRRMAAYTSFDGDRIADVTRMCMACAVVDYIPLNPEAVLGYFVSTTSLGNQKTEVMKACLAVEFKADELWIVTDGASDSLGSLPEGVRAEYLLWLEYRPGDPVRHLPWLGDRWRDFLRPEVDSRDFLDSALLSPDEHAQIQHSISDDYRRDLEERLLTPVRSDGLPPVAFLSTAEHDDKHLDWARRSAYERGRVGFSPSTMMPKIIADVLGLNADEIRSFRDDIIARCDEFWLFAKPASIRDRRFDSEVISDVQAWVRGGHQGPLRVFGWGEAGVPKYDPETPWGLTDEERNEDLP